MAYCEDYPCCGHTLQDPCERQWYDDPAKIRQHLGCDHESGYCDDIAAEAGHETDLPAGSRGVQIGPGNTQVNSFKE